MKIGILFLTLWATLTMIGAMSSHADPRQVDKIRKFYREHNLDFFGELIADQSDIFEDEKRHAKLELLADDARTRALEQLERLLKNARGPMQAELLIRKASLLADRARTATYFQNNPFKASKLKGPQFYLDQSIKTFTDVERRHGNHPKMDVVLFSIAYNYGELKKVDDAFRYYNKVIAKYPESPLVGDSRLAMAEILFDKRKFGPALAQLKEIVKSDHPKLKNFALYKMAWTYYNMSDLASGMHSLERVIEGINQAHGNQRARLELRKEALHDLVVFYAENSEVAAKDATAYFSRVGATPGGIAAEYAAARAKRLASYEQKKTAVPDEETDAYQLNEAQELLFRLTSVYRDQGKHQNAMDVAGQLMADLGRHPRVPNLYRLRAEAAEKLRRRDLVIAELESLTRAVEAAVPLVSKYEDGLPMHKLASMPEFFDSIELKQKSLEAPRSDLASTPAPVEWKEISKAEDYYRRNLSKVALETYKDFTNFFHGEWMKTQNRDTAAQATASYDLALRGLLNPWRGAPLSDAYELMYRRAQLRYALRNWDGAAGDYRFLALRRDKDREDILRGEIASLEAQLKETPVKIAKGKMHVLHERLVQAYDRFLAFYITDKKLRDVAANITATSARLFNEYGQGAQALARMMAYTQYFHDQKDAVALTRDVLVILEKEARWEELRDYSDALIEVGYYKTDGVAKDLSKANQFAHLKLLEQLEKEQDWSKAAKEFASFAKKHAESPYVSQALMKSANAAIQLKDAKLSVERLEAATGAPDEAVRLQAWLALEPYYRKAFQWKKLSLLYNSVLKLKGDAKTREGAKKNLAAIADLDASAFAAAGAKLIADDADLDKAINALEAFERSTKNYRALRFVKSNNNPQGNFKKKAELHSKLAAQADKVAGNAPKSLRGGAAVWANIMKSELLIEFAETLETAAMPAALKGATDVDRKAYTDTVAQQAKELRAKAHEMARDAADLILKVDFPSTLEARLNGLLDTFGERLRFGRVEFSKIWEKRPQLKHDADKDFAEEVVELGLEVLEQEEKDETFAKLFELAQKYYENGEAGYAAAVAGHLISEAGGEPRDRAVKLMFSLDVDRLPASLRAAAESDKLDTKARWNLARWIAGQKVAAEKASKAYSESELKWFDDAIAALLRPVATQHEKGAALSSR